MTEKEICKCGHKLNQHEFLGCAWLIINCLRLRYPASRWLIGRAPKALKDSTLLTFFDICKKLGLQSGTHYEYNSMSSVIKFYNGSEIYLKDFDDLGTEYSSAFIDEASQKVDAETGEVKYCKELK